MKSNLKLYNPVFSISIIIVQLILSVKSYFDFVNWGKTNSELDGLISRYFLSDNFFLFVLIIGFYEMLTKPSWFKTFIRVLLFCVVIGYNFLGFIPIDDFRSGVYNTAWFSAVIAFILVLWKILKKADEDWNKKKKASR